MRTARAGGLFLDARGVRERQPPKQLGKLAALFLCQPRGKELVEVDEVRRLRGLELLHALLGQDRVGDARCGLRRISARS